MDRKKHKRPWLRPLQFPFKSKLFRGVFFSTILAFIFLSGCWPLTGGLFHKHLPKSFYFPEMVIKNSSRPWNKQTYMFFESRFHMQQKQYHGNGYLVPVTSGKEFMELLLYPSHTGNWGKLATELWRLTVCPWLQHTMLQ